MATSNLLRNGWFGKAVFTISAAACAPLDWLSTAIWAAVGFGLGFQFDQYACRNHRPLRQSVDSWRLLRQAQHHNPWMIFTFAALGHMSHIAGANSPERLAHAKKLMQSLRFDGAATQRALGWYRAGKIDGCPLAELAAICRAFGHSDFETFALRSLTVASRLGDDPRVKEQCQLTLTGLSLLLGISASKASNRKSQHQAKADAPPDAHQPLPEAQARRLLGVADSADAAAIKLAYRRLAAQHHPDRLPSGATSNDRKAAEDNMAQLNSAMEALAQS